MMDKPEDAPPAGPPAVLRHEGAHRVSVAAGGHSALSAASLQPGSRLRPAVGPIPASLRQAPPVAVDRTVVEREGQVPSSAHASIGRTARRESPRRVWNPDWGDAPVAASVDDSGEWQRRLEQLAQINAQTSREVTALERDLKSAVPPPGSTP